MAGAVVQTVRLRGGCLGRRGQSTHGTAARLGAEALGAWIEIGAPAAPPTVAGAEVEMGRRAAPVVRAAGSGAEWGSGP
jgi:hypothetical protein